MISINRFKMAVPIYRKSFRMEEELARMTSPWSLATKIIQPPASPMWNSPTGMHGS